MEARLTLALRKTKTGFPGLRKRTAFWQGTLKKISSPGNLVWATGNWKWFAGSRTYFEDCMEALLDIDWLAFKFLL